MVSQLETRVTVAGSVLLAVVCCVSLALTCINSHIHNQLVISEDVPVVTTSFVLKHHDAGACHS